MRYLPILFLSIFLMVFTSCSDEMSLQEYYVNNQQDADFIALDLPADIFTNKDELDEEQLKTLNSVRKINFLALESPGNEKKFEQQKTELDQIFQNEKYQLLMKYGGDGKKAELYFTGSEEAVDELIVYAFDDSRGLGLARILGENMEPDKILKLIKSLENDDINAEGVKGLNEIFRIRLTKEKDSLI
ncbi:DUF4252 domain-containing protein [Christiangramia salexigens]|uniref:DUF4252 domain-containing protein n=1 Tax=Christiangramia salexigens TaxID=1913577 RepID=A0A1L3J3K4_9FLAO|nr:DUF4252 domain-containing protein [Christiangramia salexigens]APG59707.1 hypothetical protein LPB144_04445 [Christiangramia salexigens]